MSYSNWILICWSTIKALQISTRRGRVVLTRGELVQTRGTSPQLYACMRGREKKKQPNLWPYGWSLLIIGLKIKQTRVFNN